MRRCAAFAALLPGLGGALQPSALAAETQGEFRADLADLQAHDAQLFAVGWRLVTGNARFCIAAGDTAPPAIGLLLHDAAAYDHPQRVRQTLGLTGDIAVEAVAPGSPAAAARIVPGTTLLAVGERSVATQFPPTQERWQRLVQIDAAIAGDLADDGEVALVLQSPDGTITRKLLFGVPACLSRFEVLDSGKRALAEGSRVIFGRGFAAFAYPQEEFAAAVAHELAHNLLHHRTLLDARGRSTRLVRLTEREADRMMPWLLHNGGYDLNAAARFMAHWGPQEDPGMLRDGSHDGWDERLDFIEAEITTLEQVLERTGKADWSRYFRREAGVPENR